MSSTGFDEIIEASEDGDWLERQFFSQARMSHHDLDWGPVAPMPLGARRAMLAAFGMFAIALVGLVVFVVYANLIMPAPVSVGAEGPLLPPSAASTSEPVTADATRR
jgi:hypothetical protein